MVDLKYEPGATLPTLTADPKLPKSFPRAGAKNVRALCPTRYGGHRGGDQWLAARGGDRAQMKFGIGS